MKVFPGMTPFVDAATSDPMHQNDARGCSSLQTAGDLIGQAYAAPQHAPGILEAAQSHVTSLVVRALAAQEALSQARRDLELAPEKTVAATVAKGKKGV